MKVGPIDLSTQDGLVLEGRWDAGEAPSLAVVFCHPHPQQGGTMTAPLMKKVTTRLVEAGMAVLRFNFRGVGASEGTWGGGTEEIQDVSSAVGEASASGLAIAVGGWSFGAATALRWQAATGDRSPYCGIAPPVGDLPGRPGLRPAKRTIIMGERDQLIDFKASKVYAASIGAGFVPLAADHFFYYQEERVADHVIEAFGL